MQKYLAFASSKKAGNVLSWRRSFAFVGQVFFCESFEVCGKMIRKHIQINFEKEKRDKTHYFIRGDSCTSHWTGVPSERSARTGGKNYNKRWRASIQNYFNTKIGQRLFPRYLCRRKFYVQFSKHFRLMKFVKNIAYFCKDLLRLLNLLSKKGLNRAWFISSSTKKDLRFKIF